MHSGSFVLPCFSVESWWRRIGFQITGNNEYSQEFDDALYTIDDTNEAISGCVRICEGLDEKPKNLGRKGKFSNLKILEVSNKEKETKSIFCKTEFYSLKLERLGPKGISGENDRVAWKKSGMIEICIRIGKEFYSLTNLPWEVAASSIWH